MKDVAVALDWTPNTNHAGFYVAKAKGFYADAGLNVTLLSPHLDEYKATPASKLTSGKAHFAVTPSETVISFHTNKAEEKPKIVSVATLLQDSTSAIVTLKSSGIDRPAQLDGKRYASYAARFEGRIVQQMIKNDGGKGDYIELVPPMLGIWNTLLTGDADATWIFSAWEGIQAKRKGIELNSFKLEDYNIAYGYSPVLIALPSTLSDDADMVKAFLAATSKGYQFAVESPKAAAELLVKQVEEDTASCPLAQPLELDMCVESQEWLASHFLDASGRWGTMAASQWDAFLDWLSSSGLLTSKVQSRKAGRELTTSLDGLRAGDVGAPLPRDSIKSDSLFTNSYLP